MRKQIANIITCSRILSSIWLLFCPVFSAAFYITYLFCGITDAVDGTIARKTKTAGEFGAKLDTAADIVFTAVCLAKILPLTRLPVWIWIWIAAIAVIKIGSIILVLSCRKKMLSLHTLSNKATGFLLFLFPLTINYIEPIYSSVLVCSLAMVAAFEDVYHFKNGIEVI